MKKDKTIRIPSIRIPLSAVHSAAEEQAVLQQKIAAACGIAPAALGGWTLLKKSLDAREKGRPLFVYSVEAEVPQTAKGDAVQVQPPFTLPPARAGMPRPVVVGAGPAGLFAALLLAKAGCAPLLVEQGKDVDARAKDIANFWQKGTLDPLSNVQFGEGGAGAFSDGKLTSRSKDPLGREVLRLLIEAGADPSIAYWHKPHLGSDKLPGIIANLRRQICALGGEIRFSTRVTDLHVANGVLQGVRWQTADGKEEDHACSVLLLACGNGARGLYRMLAEKGIALEAKPFAVGVRIEHAQQTIDNVQYGRFAGHPLLGAADYALTYQDRAQQRGCYTFCNCPGGYVVNAASDVGGVVTNGMSLSDRGTAFANAAVVAQVFPGRDFGSDALDGMLFQQRLEQAAFAAAGSNYALPVMDAHAFLGGTARTAAERSTAKTAAVCDVDLHELLPEAICSSLQGALQHFEKQIPGFLTDAVLTAVETRTSAPLRMLRGEDRQSLNCRGLYPVGEGAGYAGGIVSSAIDGMRSALAVLA